MKALFLAGGMGTRLRPLTDNLPKPMVPIMGRPLLERNLEILKKQNITDVILSLCYMPKQIETYFDTGRDFGLNITYTHEDTPLGTGGAIKFCEASLSETFLVFNADIMCDIDYTEMLRFHKAMAADVTIAVTQVEDPTQYGVIETDANGYAIKFTEKPAKEEVRSNLINAGIYIMEKSVLAGLLPNQKISVERDVFPTLLAAGKKIAVYNGLSYWLDIGTPEKYMQAQYDVFKGKYNITEASFPTDTIYTGRNSQITGPITLRGPVYIGPNAVIHKGAVIGPNVVVGENSVIGSNCEVRNCVLWNNVQLTNNRQIQDIVMVDPLITMEHKNKAFTPSYAMR